MIPLLLATLLATNMSSSDYKLQWTNLNMTSGSKSSDNYQILDTVGQTAPGEYASSGYYVKAGFPYIKTIIPFTFTISDLSIDFGTLTPGVFPSPPPSNTLTVSSGGAGGYSVTASEDHPLKMQTSAITIANVTPGVWTDTSKYGFGYNMSGNDIPAVFTDPTYFKPFADASQSEAAEIVMSSANVGKSRLATVTYQANIGPAQAAGDYENSITFIATPGY